MASWALRERSHPHARLLLRAPEPPTDDFCHPTAELLPQKFPARTMLCSLSTPPHQLLCHEPQENPLEPMAGCTRLLKGN